MNENIFFGLVRKNGIDPLANLYSLGGDPEYELYLVNDSDKPLIIKHKSFGGFETYDDVAATFDSQDGEVSITVEPHCYVLYCELYEDSFSGAGQYRAFFEIEDKMKMLEFYNSDCAGFMGTRIPCVNKYGRVIRPIIQEL